MIKYKGYVATCEVDTDNEVIHGRVVNIKDTITYECISAKEVRVEFCKSVDVYLEFCKERGEQPEQPMKYWMVRGSRDTRRYVI